MTLPSPPVFMPSELPPDPPPRRSGLVRVLDVLLRVVGGLVAVAAAAVTAAVELILAAVRVGGYLIGVSVLVAVLANIALSWFAHRAVGGKSAILLPAVVWFGLMVVAAGGTREGDFLLAGNNWVALLMIVAGAMTFAVMAFRLIIAPRRDPAGGLVAPRSRW